MRKLLFVIACFSIGLVQAQSISNETFFTELKASIKVGHYNRAYDLIHLFSAQLKVREVANMESYDQARKLQDSVKAHINYPALDATNVLTTQEDPIISKHIEKLEKAVVDQKINKSIYLLDELNFRLQIKEAKEKKDLMKVPMLESALKTYINSNVSASKDETQSVCINEVKIQKLEEKLALESTQSNEDSAGIFKTELDMRLKVKESVDQGRFLSAKMDNRPLQAFVANPYYTKPAPKVAFVPVTENQKRLVYLEQKMVEDRKAGKYINLWPMTQEIDLRNKIEQATKKGDEEAIKKYESQISLIVFQ